MFDSAGVGWGEPLTEAARRVYSIISGCPGSKFGTLHQNHAAGDEQPVSSDLMPANPQSLLA